MWQRGRSSMKVTLQTPATSTMAAGSTVYSQRAHHKSEVTSQNKTTLLIVYYQTLREKPSLHLYSPQQLIDEYVS